MNFPSLDMAKTGANIARLRKERGVTVAKLQNYLGLSAPQAIYKWERGQNFPTVDNLYALSIFLKVPMEKILVPANNIPSRDEREGVFLLQRMRKVQICCETGRFMLQSFCLL